jgi:methylglutaconyl-CoA hydratase
MSEQATIRIERDERGVATVTMDRPEVRNAFNDELIARLEITFTELAEDADARVVVLTGADPVFSAGADLSWLGGMADYSFGENIADSRALDRMLRAVHDCPRPVVARVNGHALGGGTGLVAACDVAVAVDGAKLGFTEVRLGVAPAVIAPYVLRRIGVARARPLFLTGERFDAATARDIGLVDHVVAADELDAAVADAVDDLLRGGPGAQAEIKALLRTLAETPDLEAAAERTVETIARLRVSEEGQEGMGAFLDKRSPAWVAERDG